MVLHLALALGAALAALPDGAILKLGEPVAWAQIDADALKGRPARLAWSDDRSELYLQVVDGTTAANLKFRHYLVRKGASLTAIQTQPAWVQEYWKWKSAKMFFGDPQLTIEVDTGRELADNLNGTGANKAAYLSDTPLTGTQLLLSRQPGETHVTNRLVLKGEIIGEFVDEAITPGYTFSWSPEELRMIAFRSTRGRLTIMSDAGKTQTVGVASDVILPAWSYDGAAIAYLERKSHKTFTVYVIEIQQR
jgi:hypothetical protein